MLVCDWLTAKLYICVLSVFSIGKTCPGQKPGWTKALWSKAPTNKHLNFKTNLFDIYTCNISESLPSDDVSNALQCLYKCFIVIIVCLAQIEESIL